MNVKALIEAILFVSDKALSKEKIAEIVGTSLEVVEKVLEDMKEEMRNENRGIFLAETPSGFEFRVKPEYREKVIKIAPFSDLSQGMLRCLALIAANQPIKQSLIVKYQGNKAYGYIEKLEEKGLIKTQQLGRTKMVFTTPYFEEYFGKKEEEIRKILEASKLPEDKEDN